MSSKKKTIEIGWAKSRDKSVEERKFVKKLTENHLKYKRTIEDKLIILGIGSAGTGKTCLAVEVAVDLFKTGKVDHIVLTRPLVECDEALGFLPGNVDEKMAFFVAPLINALSTHFNSHDLEVLKKEEKIQIIPLGQMRGNTFTKSIMIMDEAQNASYRQIKMFITRLGFGSKAIVNGDLNQSDIVGGINNVPLLQAIRDLIYPNIPNEIGLSILGSDDVLRPDIVQMVSERMGDNQFDMEELLGLIGLEDDFEPTYINSIKSISRKSKSSR